MHVFRLGWWAALAALFGSTLATAGCGGGDDADFEAPVCGDAEVIITGTVAGQAVDAESPIESSVFVNAINGEPGTLAIGGPGNTGNDPPLLLLNWDELVANGDATGASGLVDFSATGGVHVGNCADQGDRPGILRLDADGDGGAFLLRDLYQDADCSQPAVDGEVRGCYRTSGL